ncbi:MAG: RNA methyltransferase [Thiovulaceae bacterium]|nr:RNA methyltransferase [Sulfurimonadaceae bacterium]
MNLIKIDDLNTPAMAIYAQLRDNAFTKDNSFIADSPKVGNMILESDIEVRSILATQAYYDEFEELIHKKGVPQLFLADKKVMETIIGHRLHHNVMMHGIRPAQTPLEQLGENILMLDKTSSSENIGAIARSAAALGVGSYLLPEQGPHPYGRRALRVSMGHVCRLKINLYRDIFATLEALKADGYRVFGAEVTDEATLLAAIEVPKKWVLLMGHEGKGLSQEVLAACDEAVQIEIEPDVRSFNVAIAASILMYQFKNRG